MLQSWPQSQDAKLPAARAALATSSDGFILKMAHGPHNNRCTGSHKPPLGGGVSIGASNNSSDSQPPASLPISPIHSLPSRTTLNLPAPHPPLLDCFPIINLENLLSNTSPNQPGHPAVNCRWISSIKFLKTIPKPPTDQNSCSLVRTSLANPTEVKSDTT